MCAAVNESWSSIQLNGLASTVLLPSSLGKEKEKEGVMTHISETDLCSRSLISSSGCMKEWNVVRKNSAIFSLGGRWPAVVSGRAIPPHSDRLSPVSTSTAFSSVAPL